jgi:hypothetical protein
MFTFWISDFLFKILISSKSSVKWTGKRFETLRFAIWKQKIIYSVATILKIFNRKWMICFYHLTPKMTKKFFKQTD